MYLLTILAGNFINMCCAVDHEKDPAMGPFIIQQFGGGLALFNL